jgi:hypothetical protein
VVSVSIFCIDYIVLTHYKGRQFDVTYLTEEDVRRTIVVQSARQETSFSAEKSFSQCFLEMLTENGYGYEGKNLNQACPHIRPVGIEEFLKKWWGEKA